MKTIDELAQVLLTVDSRLDLVLLGNDNTGLVVDDDLHRELFDAVEAAMLRPDVNNVSEFCLDEGGGFQMNGEKFDLVYTYQPQGVVWSYQEA